MSECEDPNCECDCHDDCTAHEVPNDDEYANIIDSIDMWFQPTAKNGNTYRKDHDKLLTSALEKLEDAIEGQPDDPGKLYPLHERVRRVVGALQSRARQ